MVKNKKKVPLIASHTDNKLIYMDYERTVHITTMNNHIVESVNECVANHKIKRYKVYNGKYTVYETLMRMINQDILETFIRGAINPESTFMNSRGKTSGRIAIERILHEYTPADPDELPDLRWKIAVSLMSDKYNYIIEDIIDYMMTRDNSKLTIKEFIYYFMHTLSDMFSLHWFSRNYRLTLEADLCSCYVESEKIENILYDINPTVMDYYAETMYSTGSGDTRLQCVIITIDMSNCCPDITNDILDKEKDRLMYKALKLYEDENVGYFRGTDILLADLKLANIYITNDSKIVMIIIPK